MFLFIFLQSWTGPGNDKDLWLFLKLVEAALILYLHHKSCLAIVSRKHIRLMMLAGISFN
jgi:hypothetical protein